MNQGTIEVRGQGRATVDPDVAVVALTISVIRDSYSKTMTTLNDQIDTLRDELSEQGIDREQLKTTGFGIEEHYELQERKNYKTDSKPIFAGFDGTHSLELRLPVDTDLLNRVLMAVADSETDARFSLSFTIRDPTRIKRKMLAAGVREARADAEAMAEAAGASLGAVLHIDYTWNEVHFTSEVTYSAPEMSEGHSAMPDIEPNSISGSEEVRVQWELVQ
jgi:uncharacterized protein